MQQKKEIQDGYSTEFKFTFILLTICALSLKTHNRIFEDSLLAASGFFYLLLVGGFLLLGYFVTKAKNSAVWYFIFKSVSFLLWSLSFSFAFSNSLDIPNIYRLIGRTTGIDFPSVVVSNMRQGLGGFGTPIDNSCVLFWVVFLMIQIIGCCVVFISGQYYSAQGSNDENSLIRTGNLDVKKKIWYINIDMTEQDQKKHKAWSPQFSFLLVPILFLILTILVSIYSVTFTNPTLGLFSLILFTLGVYCWTLAGRNIALARLLVELEKGGHGRIGL